MTEVENPEWIMRKKYSRKSESPRRFMSSQKFETTSPEATDTMRKSQLENKVKPFHMYDRLPCR